MIGMGRESKLVYLIDFGTSQWYQDVYTNRHLPYYEGYSMSEQSRRDDMISTGYMLLYILKGSLPWD